ncbi:MAG: MFS transporter [Anaerolineae bacterium]
MNLAQSEKNRWWSLFFICISLLVISLDNTILNTALPSISRALGATASQLQWVLDSYVLVFAAMLLTMGSIGDRIGRKRTLQFGLVWFAIGSLIAAFSSSTDMLIVMRAIMGVGGATIMPATLSLITATFRDRTERSRAIGVWAGVFALGVGIGPVVGGWLLEHFDWGSVFLVNLPIAAIALIGGHFLIADSRDENAPRPDVPGVLLSILGLFALVYAIIEAGQSGWTEPNVIIAFVAAAALLGLFGWWESRSSHPMLPVKLFRNMSFTGANIAVAMLTFCLFGALFFLSQFFQSVQGFTPLQAGIRLLPMSVMAMIAAGISARLSDRFGIKIVVAAGLAIGAVGFFYMSNVASADISYEMALIGLCVTSLGIGLAMPVATDSIMGSVPVDKAGVGSAMNDTTRQIGGALGIAILGTIMNRTYLTSVDTLLTTNPVFAALPERGVDAIRASITGAHIVADQIPLAPLANQLKDTANAAFVTGMKDALLVGTVILVAAALLTFIILPSRIRTSEAETPAASTVSLQGAD